MTLPGRATVVVAGGGPAGLACAMELGLQGVEVLVLEPRREVSPDRPRAKTTSVRTMEHLRRWGIAEELRAAAPLPVSWSQDAVFCTTLLGREITRITNCFGLSPARSDAFAESGQQVSQAVFEQALRSALGRLPSVQLALGWSLTDGVDSDHAVVVTASDDDGATRVVQADFLLGCDGARSRTRQILGARYEGTADSRPNFNMVFQAPTLASLVPHGPAVHYWILDAAVPGVMGRLDLDGRWWAGALGVSEATGSADPTRLIRAMAGPGAEDVDIEIVSTDPWTARMLLADTYGRGRIFLVGDAAHQNPPWGGHGFNTCIGDAVNIGWKLAAVLQGWADASLLHTYEAERRPVAAQTIEDATINMSRVSSKYTDPTLDDDGLLGERTRAAVAAAVRSEKDSEFHSLGLVLGYHYAASSAVVDDGTAWPEHDPVVYAAMSRPGARLPHLWMPDGKSLYDALGPGFTILQLDPETGCGELVQAAQHRGVPMRTVDLSQMPGLVETYEAALLLVRPDQHVAWRSFHSPNAVEAGQILDVVLKGSTPHATPRAEVPLTRAPGGG